MERNLADTLQALYDSEINVTITMLWDGGFDFALCSYMEPLYGEPGAPGWHHVSSAAGLAEVLHEEAVLKYPHSQYARDHRAAIGSKDCADWATKSRLNRKPS